MSLLTFFYNQCYSQETNTVSDGAQPQKTISKAMKAYLERAKEHEEFMKTQRHEYQLGKRHLANMMGEDPETFTQEDVDVSLEIILVFSLHNFVLLECHRVFISIWNL